MYPDRIRLAALQDKIMSADAAAAPHEIRPAIGGAGGGVDQHDIERLQPVADAVERRSDIGRGGDIAVGEVRAGSLAEEKHHGIRIRTLLGLVQCLREVFGFEGTPIVTNMRVRERRQR